MNWLRRTAAGCGALGIAAAAFGAHGLEGIATADQVRWWAIAVALQLVTVPVLLFLSLSGQRAQIWSALSLLAGLLLFSGSLYAIALGAPRILGAVTPVGGLFLIAGWFMVGVSGDWKGEG